MPVKWTDFNRNLFDRCNRYEDAATRRAQFAWAAERGIDVVELPLDGDLSTATV